MQNLTEGENLVLGSSAAFVEAVVLQPTIYWKNAAQQGLGFTLNPRLLWRGLAATCINEMGQMGLQFGCTGGVKRLVAGENNAKLGPAQEFAAAIAGGAIVAPFACALEVAMIQQQRFGGSLVGTTARIIRDFSLLGMQRGLVATTLRDSIYVGGLLGVTPIVQEHLVQHYGWGVSSAGLWASLGASFLEFCRVLLMPSAQ